MGEGGYGSKWEGGKPDAELPPAAEQITAPGWFHGHVPPTDVTACGGAVPRGTQPQRVPAARRGHMPNGLYRELEY